MYVCVFCSRGGGRVGDELVSIAYAHARAIWVIPYDDDDFYGDDDDAVS